MIPTMLRQFLPCPGRRDQPGFAQHRKVEPYGPEVLLINGLVEETLLQS
jgi:hypothetical protein